ncbi:MAG: hypothetical protein EOP56_09180 [Sphingobacteriales bacterium]|nr:MAG: hypothetical protein EOP56_09180 [Sphingobacteriales bacterium]
METQKAFHFSTPIPGSDPIVNLHIAGFAEFDGEEVDVRQGSISMVMNGIDVTCLVKSLDPYQLEYIWKSIYAHAYKLFDVYEPGKRESREVAPLPDVFGSVKVICEDYNKRIIPGYASIGNGAV